MALHLQSDFNIKEWVGVILLLTDKTAPLLERASRGSDVEAAEIIYYTQVPVTTKWTVTDAAESSATTIYVNADLWARLSAWYLLMVGDERIMVTAVGATTWSGASAKTALTVTRGWGSTPASSIAANADIKIMSKAESEWKITEDYKAFGEKKFKNVIQTFTKSIYVTKQAARFKHKTKIDLLNDERKAKTNEQLVEINRTLYYWVAVLDESEEKRNTLGGWKEAINKQGGYILDAGTSASGVLTEWMIENALLWIKERWGNPDAIFLNARTKKMIVDWFSTKRLYNEDRRNEGAGVRLTYYTSDTFGKDLLFVIDECIETGDIFIGRWEPVIHVFQDPDNNVDEFFTDYREPTDSQVIKETIKTTITAEFLDASKEAFITGVTSATSDPINVNIVNASAINVNVANTSESPVHTSAVVANTAENPVPTQAITA